MPIYGAEQTPYLVPAVRDITAITNAFPAQVTTYQIHGYNNGAIIRLRIPPNFGMTQADTLQGTITVIDSYNFAIALDTTSFDLFVVPPEQPGYNYTSAQAVPVGSTQATISQNAFINNLTPLF